MNTAPDSGSGDSTGDIDTGGDDGTGGGGGGVAALTGYVDELTSFASNPRGFIFGAVLVSLLEAVLGAVTMAFDQLILIAGGSQPTRFNAPGETIGIADIPVAVVDTVGGTTGFGAQALISGIEGFNEVIAGAAATVGPFGPAVLIVLIVVEVIVAILILERLVYIAADLLQLGGITE